MHSPWYHMDVKPRLIKKKQYTTKSTLLKFGVTEERQELAHTTHIQLSYAGHILGNTSGQCTTLLKTMKGTLEEKRGKRDHGEERLARNDTTP